MWILTANFSKEQHKLLSSHQPDMWLRKRDACLGEAIISGVIAVIKNKNQVGLVLFPSLAPALCISFVTIVIPHLIILTL